MVLPDDSPGSTARNRLRAAVFETAKVNRADPCDGPARARFIVAFHDYAAARAAMLRKNPDNQAYWMTLDDYHVHQTLELQYMHGFIDNRAQRQAISGPRGYLMTPQEGGGGWASRKRAEIEPACERAKRGEALAPLVFWALKPPMPQSKVAEFEARNQYRREVAERSMLETLEPPDAILCGAGQKAFLSGANHYFQQRISAAHGEGFRKGEAARIASEQAWASGHGAMIDARLKRLAGQGCLKPEDLPYDIARPLFER